MNKFGQVIGRKGSDTRARAIEALEQLLTESRGVEPTAAAIARAAGMTAPAFYLYFKDVGEAVLALIEQLEERFEFVLRLLNEPWPSDELLARAKSFVEAYFIYWSANAPLLRVRNRLADQGDDRFIRLRAISADKMSDAMVAKIDERPFADGLPCKSRSVASVLITALERLATVSVLNLYPDSPTNQDEMINALANMIAMTMREGA